MVIWRHSGITDGIDPSHYLSTNYRPLNSLRPQKLTSFCRRHFEMNFLGRKCLNFNQNVTEFCSGWSNQQFFSIGSEIGLAPNRQQAIIWISDGIDYWHRFTPLGRNKLKMSSVSFKSVGYISWWMSTWHFRNKIAVMTWKRFRITGPLLWDFADTQKGNADLQRFLCC